MLLSPKKEAREICPTYMEVAILAHLRYVKEQKMKIASVYIHIPFCLRKCNYCDFVSYPLADCSTVRGHYPQLVLQELELYREELDFSPLRTIYFGGGTPSILEAAEISQLLAAFPAATEITLEANPETLDEAKLAAFYQAGINRLSLGVQSFKPQLLTSMGRGHTSEQSQAMVAAARRLDLLILILI